LASERHTEPETVGSLKTRIESGVDVLLRHTIPMLVVVFTIAAALVLWNQSRLANRLVDTTTLAEVERYSNALATFRTLYTRDVVEIVRDQNIEVTHDFDAESKRGKAIPLPATLSMKLGNELAKNQEGGFTRLYSDFPFPYPDRSGLRDEFARDAWEALNANPDMPFYRKEIVDGRPALRFATADLMRQSCVDCHNTHPDTPKDDWVKGDVRGVLEVTLPLETAEQQVATSLRQSFLLLGFLGVVGVAALAIVIGRLRRTTVELEERVEERTRQLAESTEAAQSASRAKSEFLAKMSHEIRTPLNAVIGLSEIVLKTELDETQRHHLGTVVDSAESLLTVINDILDFSKIEAGRLELERVAFNLHDTVGDTLKSLALRAEHKNIELACFVDPHLPGIVIGDPGRLRQILVNLVGNALKFTDEGEVVVRAEAEGDVPPAGRSDEPASGGSVAIRIHFSVRDTGIGIKPDQLDGLFGQFVQADSSTTRKYGGTGLGLSICRKLVDLMGGQISAESMPGEGSTFHFTARFDVSTDASEASLYPTVPRSMRGLRVLIVDDNATNREILEEVTRAKGLFPFSAESAEVALQKLRELSAAETPVQLVLSDVHMPGKDGYTLAENIRAEFPHDLPIILLTSAGESGDPQRCADLKIAGRLMKPIKQSELLQVMQRTIGLEPDAVRLPEGQVSLGTERIPHTPPLKILLVEDSRANQQVALAILNEHSHQIVTAMNGEQAVTLFDSQEFDLVLMDVQMPTMDGYQATAAIRAKEDGTGRRTPIIAMTAHALKGDRERCLAAGMDDYVSKPIRREDLFAAIARMYASLVDRPEPSAEQTPAATSAAGPEALPQSDVIDWSILSEMVAGKSDLMLEVTALYVVEIRENLAALPEAIQSENKREIRRLAHTLASAFRMFRAETASQHASNIEQHADSGPEFDLLAECEHLQDCVVTVLSALEIFVEDQKGK
jgi:signal transduction histidine kinase/CheY-like chemotaxis protein/HPt (histidine-containing phosphotransfer) domain-containing protein